MSLDGEKACFTRTRLARTDTCAKRLVAAGARKSRQICSYGDSLRGRLDDIVSSSSFRARNVTSNVEYDRLTFAWKNEILHMTLIEDIVNTFFA